MKWPSQESIHTRPAAHRGSGEPHDLEAHLTKVAEGAKIRADVFGGGDLARLAGLWHDLGKYNPDWQDYLQHAAGVPEDAHLELEKAPTRGPEHSSAGALHSRQWLLGQGILEKSADLLARVLAYPVMGHHAGLADFSGGEGSLYHRLHEPSDDHLKKALRGQPPPQILDPVAPAWKDMYVCLTDRDPAFFIRMLFSCLVDADFLDTESYMSPEKRDRRMGYPSLAVMQAALQDALDKKLAASPSSPINAARAEVLAACRASAEESPGFFSLIVPTGGGKTLSSLAFALKHALHHGKRRVIYAIPYTSIIEQTAEVFRTVFSDLGEEVLVEHHSNVADVASERESSRQRLASENWDAPLVVTTTVQLFESFYASRTSRCRKLHNVADSVIILDEAHLIPPELRFPILHVLNELVEHYGVTVVLCTATPTGIEDLRRETKYAPALTRLQPIVREAESLYARLKRVRVETHLREEDRVLDWGVLAAELVQCPQVLCIVSRRDDCRDLYDAMPDGTIHLSALMCAEHRSAVIGDIKKKLEEGRPVRVISTQLVEAGVDIDFPVVYRALAGLDSLAQAAGRCNREGKLEAGGRLVVFLPPRHAPRGILRQAEQTAEDVLRLNPQADLLSPEAQMEYFKRFYGRCENGDKYHILEDCFRENREYTYQFRDAAERFRIIEDVYKTVIISYGNDDLLEQLYRGKPEKWLLRKTQRYTVSVPPAMLDKLLTTGAVREILPGLFAQDKTQAPHLYHATLGLMPEHHNEYPAGDLVI